MLPAIVAQRRKYRGQIWDLESRKAKINYNDILYTKILSDTCNVLDTCTVFFLTLNISQNYNQPFNIIMFVKVIYVCAAFHKWWWSEISGWMHTALSYIRYRLHMWTYTVST